MKLPEVLKALRELRDESRYDDIRASYIGRRLEGLLDELDDALDDALPPDKPAPLDRDAGVMMGDTSEGGTR